MIEIFIGITALILGSFYNVCIYRLPKKKSIAFPPSNCPKCNHVLKPWDLVPILSYIFLKGHCRYCGEKVSPRYPIVELTSLILSLLLYCQYGLTWSFVAYQALTGILIIATFIDIEYQIIPNSLVLAGTILGLFLSLFEGTVDIFNALLGLLAGGGILLMVALISLMLFKKEGMGGGDIKLMGMIGLFLGWKNSLLALLLSIYIGGIAAIVLLLLKSKKPGQYIPFGPFIALGTLLTLFLGNLIVTWYIRMFFGG